MVMVREAIVDRGTLEKKYRGINPTLADRVLTSSERMARSGIMQIESKYASEAAFRLLIDVAAIREERGEGELADLARKTAEAISHKLPERERMEASQKLVDAAPGTYRYMRGKPAEVEEVPHELLSFWNLVDKYNELARKGSITASREMLKRAFVVLEKMEKVEAQRTIAEIEAQMPAEEAGVVLLEIMKAAKGEEIRFKATVHFSYCVEALGKEKACFLDALKEVIDEQDALEILSMALQGEEMGAWKELAEKYPSAGARHMLPMLNIPPAQARERIELAKRMVEGAGARTSIPNLVEAIEPGSTNSSQVNLLTVIREVLNGSERDTLNEAFREVGEGGKKKNKEKTVWFFDMLLEQAGIERHVKESALWALHFTWMDEAIDVAEKNLERWGEGDEALRYQAYISLEKLFARDELRVESIIARGAEHPEEDPRTRTELIRWLGDNSTGIGYSALRRIAGKSEDERIMSCAAENMGRLMEKSSRHQRFPGKGTRRDTTSVRPGRASTEPPVRITPIRKISRPPR